MEVSSFSSRFHIPSHQIPGKQRRCRKLHRRRRPPSNLVAIRKDEDVKGGVDGDQFWERLVDDNMPTLRRRADEFKLVEVAGEEDKGTMICECEKKKKKKKYCLFHSELFEVVGLMQLDLEAKQPKLGVGMSIMVTVTMPVSVIVLFLHIIDAAKLISKGFDDENK